MLQFENYLYKYPTRGKIIYVPNERCEKRGERLINFFSHRVKFPDYFYHYKSGGHVSALHAHLKNRFFFKIDIEHFFYSIARNRVTRVLCKYDFKPATNFAKWSTVRNPYPGPRYVLPIGFIQSPLLASLALLNSGLIEIFKKAQSRGALISLYLDDIVGSHQDFHVLEEIYEEILDGCVESQLLPNQSKLVAPADAIVAFNCDLQFGAAKVTSERIQKFLSEDRSAHAAQSFEDYKLRVSRENL